MTTHIVSIMLQQRNYFVVEILEHIECIVVFFIYFTPTQSMQKDIYASTH